MSVDVTAYVGEIRAIRDREALHDFEALVQAQKPATAPWQPITDYSFDARKAIEGQHPRLVKDVFKASTIYDAGCGPHAIFLRLLDECGAATHHVCGFDPLIDEDNPPHRNAFNGDVVTGIRGCYERHDLVICREVLEHLTIRQIRQAVATLCGLSDRWVYVTTRFAPAPQHLLDVATSDDLDPTHITLLNQSLLRLLFVLEGFKRRADLETALDWKQLNRVLVYERA